MPKQYHTGIHGARGNTELVLDALSRVNYRFGMNAIRKYRVSAGLSQEALARAAGTSQPQIKRLEAGDRKLTKEWAERLSIPLGVSPAQLLFEGDEGEQECFSGTGDAIVARPTSGILELDVRAGMGGGGITDGRDVVHNGQYVDPVKDEAWHFPSSFLRDELRAPERRIQILETQGDSMAPTIMSGDRVIIDTGHTTPSPDGIYAIRDRFGAIVVKRLQVLRRGEPPIIRIISDNRAHDSEDVGVDEIQIFGRVLWGLKRL